MLDDDFNDNDDFNDVVVAPPILDDVILPEDFERDGSEEAVKADCDEFLDYYRETTGQDYHPDLDGDLADEIWEIHSQYKSADGGHRSLTESAKEYLAKAAHDKSFLEGFDEG